MQHLGLAPPELLNAAGSEAGIRQQVIDALGAELVPLAQGMQLPANQRAEPPLRQSGTAEISVHLIPGVTHRCVDVAEMQLIRSRQHPFGHQMTAADHQLGIPQVDLLDRQRKQRQVLLNVAGAPGQLLDRAGADVAPEQPTAGT